jgi:hypothetical protein
VVTDCDLRRTNEGCGGGGYEAPISGIRKAVPEHSYEQADTSSENCGATCHEKMAEVTATKHKSKQGCIQKSWHTTVRGKQCARSLTTNQCGSKQPVRLTRKGDDAGAYAQDHGRMDLTVCVGHCALRSTGLADGAKLLAKPCLFARGAG